MSRPTFVIRKQKPGMPRPGQPMKWIGACQRCGRALASEQWGDVIRWASAGHACLVMTQRVTWMSSPRCGEIQAVLGMPGNGLPAALAVAR